MKIVSLTSLFIFLVACEIKPSQFSLSFDYAMKKNYCRNFDSILQITKEIIGVEGVTLYNFFKNLYEKNCSLTPSLELKIPKIIHQIWLGSPFPQEFKQLQQSWLLHHMNRDWVYILWTDKEVAELTLYNQKFYDAVTNNGIKSDLLRYELLYLFGGVYVDSDYECLAALDELHYTYDFYTGLQPLDSSFVQLGNALIASRPQHPILKHCIETIQDDWHLKGAPKKTGPVHLTKSFYTCLNQTNATHLLEKSTDIHYIMGDVIALPAFYFCPLGCQERCDKRIEWKEHGALAVHWWAKSWMPREYRPALSKTICNDTTVKSWND